MSPEARERKKLKKKERQTTGNPINRQQLFLREIKPITKNQNHVFKSWYADQHLLLHGLAGTGKSFISLYLLLQDVISQRLQKIYIVRSAVPTRDMGFLPGSLKEKAEVYEAPYRAIFNELFGRGDAYEVMKQKGLVEFVTSSYLRGITLDNCGIFVDEMQNCTLHELDSIITRAGENTRLIFSGDGRQTDFTREFDKTGLNLFIKIIRDMRQFEVVEFSVSDIVRSELVKDYILAKDSHGITT